MTPAKIRPRASSSAAPPTLGVVCPFPLDVAPGQRYRWERYLDRLEDDGISVVVLPLIDREAYDILYGRGRTLRKAASVLTGFSRRLIHVLTANKVDVILLYREAFIFGGPWFERLLFRSGTPVIFDFDDAIWLPNVSAANRWIARLKRSEKTSEILAGSRIVLAGNEYLASFARRFAKDVRVLPTVIDTDWYRCSQAALDVVQAGRRPVMIGWTGSPTTAPYLELVEPVLARLQAEHAVGIRIIGAPDYRPSRFAAEIIPWTSSREVEDLCPIDIGIMPLPDNEWTRGKCGGKLLQYMGLGKAAVASPVGVNKTIVQHGRNGLLAEGATAWYEALSRLIHDPDLRASLGAAARATVEEEYSVSATYPRFRQAVEDALSTGRKKVTGP